MRLAPFIAVLLAAAGVLNDAPRAYAHPGQSIDVRITIDDKSVTMQLLVSADLMYGLMQDAGLDPKLFREADPAVGFADDETEKKARNALMTIFEDSNSMRINGTLMPYTLASFQLVTPVMYAMAFAEYPPDIRVVFTIEAPEPPRDVAIGWTIFPQDMSRATFGLPIADDVVAWLKTPYEDTVIVFKPEEPEYVWHAPREGLRERGVPAITTVEQPTLPIPLLSLPIAVAWLVIVGVARSSHAWPRLKRPVALLTLPVICVAAYAHGAWNVHVPAPWKPAHEPPPEKEAIAIFQSLQRNIYGAFEQLDEDGVYDVLAHSVDGDLLDEVYNEVYQSLILRDQGGAVARVKGVEILDANLDSSGVLDTEQAAAFHVRSRWRVHGAVYHWGHIHSRTNEYRALFTVAQCAGNWRITAINNMEQQRVPMPGDDPELERPADRRPGS